MFKVLFRSACVGVAAVVVSACLGIPIVTYIVSRNVSNTGDVEMGWDLVSMAHTWPIASVVAPLVAFAIGFAIGFRYFSRSLPSK